MSRKKAAQNAEIRPWLSARGDCKEGRFIQVGNSLLLSKEFQSLSPGAMHMYICMAMESGGKKRFIFPKGAGEKYGIPRTSYDRYIKELRKGRFIVCTEDNHTLRRPNVYDFCSAWKL